MSALTLEGVRIEPDEAVLVSAGISRPAEGEPLGEASFVVRGWALGDAARALAVEMRAGNRLVRVAPVREATPEVAEAHPNRPGARHSGFLTRVHAGALGSAAELRLDAVLANGTRARIGTIALGRSEAPPRERREPRTAPSIRADVERLVLEEAERLGVQREGLLEQHDIRDLDDVELEGRTVLDLSGGPGHVARAARARGAALVDSVHLDPGTAGLARLLDLYHRTTRVFVHDSLESLDRSYDVVLMLGAPPPISPEDLEKLASGPVIRP